MRLLGYKSSSRRLGITPTSLRRTGQARLHAIRLYGSARSGWCFLDSATAGQTVPDRFGRKVPNGIKQSKGPLPYIEIGGLVSRVYRPSGRRRSLSIRKNRRPSPAVLGPEFSHDDAIGKHKSAVGTTLPYSSGKLQSVTRALTRVHVNDCHRAARFHGPSWTGHSR